MNEDENYGASIQGRSFKIFLKESDEDNKSENYNDKIVDKNVAVCTAKEPNNMPNSFHKRSKKNLRELLNTIEQNQNVFCTLTYRDAEPNSKKWKKDIKLLSEFIKYNLRESWFIYRFEPQKTGKPHVHLVGYVSNPKQAKKMITKEWCKITKCNNEHLVDLKKICKDDVEKINSYMCKEENEINYSNEYFHEWKNMKSKWGWINKKNIKLCPKICVDITDSDIKRYREIMVNHQEKDIEEMETRMVNLPPCSRKSKLKGSIAKRREYISRIIKEPYVRCQLTYEEAILTQQQMIQKI